MEGRGLKGLARSLRPKVSYYGLNHKQVPHFDLLKIHSQEFTPNRENEYMPLFIVVFFFSFPLRGLGLYIVLNQEAVSRENSNILVLI